MIHKGIMEKIRNNKNLAVILFAVYIALVALSDFIVFNGVDTLFTLFIDLGLIIIIILGYYIDSFKNASKLALLGLMAYKLIGTAYDIQYLAWFYDNMPWYAVLTFICYAVAGFTAVAIIVLLVVKLVTNNNSFTNILILLLVIAGCFLAAAAFFSMIGQFVNENTTQGVADIFGFLAPAVLAFAFVASFDRANLKFVESSDSNKSSEE